MVVISAILSSPSPTFSLRQGDVTMPVPSTFLYLFETSDDIEVSLVGFV